MYNIGICDDGKNICASLEEMVLLYAEKSRRKMDIQVWYTGEELCRYLEQGGHLDILFLDIELIRLTGIEVGDFIRNKMEDRGMQIIYISGESSYAQQLFKTQPMDFLVKPVSTQQIEDALELAVKLLEKNAERFAFQNGRDYYYIPYGEIIYFESMGRKIKISAVDAEKEFYGSIRELEQKLPGEFFAIHQSYVINRTHVVRYTYETVEMDDVSSGNLEIDSVMNYMIRRAREELRTVNVNVRLPNSLGHSFDINVILGNLLENGIEAARQTESRRLDINVEAQQGFLRIQIENSYDGRTAVSRGNGHQRLLTTKRGGGLHGIGLESVRKVVEKYDGIMEVCPEEDIFRVLLILYMPEVTN